MSSKKSACRGSAVVRVAMTLAVAGAWMVFAAPAQAGKFKLYVLNFQGQEYSVAAAINDSDQVVGSYMDGNDVIHGLVWNNGGMLQVDPPGSLHARLAGINAQGVGVGDFGDAKGGTNAFTDNLATQAMTVIGVNAPSRYYQGLGISDDEAVYGKVGNGHGPDESFVAKAGRLRKFNVPGADYTVISAISDHGGVLGYYVPRGDKSVAHGFTLRHGVLTSFDPPGAVNTLPAVFGADGMILGSYLDGNGVSHGFVRRGATFTSYDHPGATGTTLIGMTGHRLVGNYSNAQSGSTGFFYDGKRYEDFSIEGASLTQINAVNSGGSLAGTYFTTRTEALYGFIAVCPAAPCTEVKQQ